MPAWHHDLERKLLNCVWGYWHSWKSLTAFAWNVFIWYIVVVCCKSSVHFSILKTILGLKVRAGGRALACMWLWWWKLWFKSLVPHRVPWAMPGVFCEHKTRYTQTPPPNKKINCWDLTYNQLSDNRLDQRTAAFLGSFGTNSLCISTCPWPRFSHIISWEVVWFFTKNLA